MKAAGLLIILLLLALGVAPQTLTLVRPHTIHLYAVKVSSPYPAVEGGGLYPAGSLAVLKAKPEVALAPGLKAIFLGWEGDLKSQEPVLIILVDQPKRIVALWRLEKVTTSGEGVKKPGEAPLNYPWGLQPTPKGRGPLETGEREIGAETRAPVKPGPPTPGEGLLAVGVLTTILVAAIYLLKRRVRGHEDYW